LVALLDEFCPDCGKHRVALFRFCLGCGLDFDELDARGELPGGPYSPLRTGPHVPHRQSIVSPRVQARRRPLSQYVPVGMAAVLAIAVVGALAISVRDGATTTASRESGPTAPPAAVAAETAVAPTPTPEPVFAPTGETTRAVVTRVIDGDTIIVRVEDTDYRVRYIGIDAPESVSIDRPVEFMAPEAADANRRLVSSANVILERDESETDQYGQLLRNVWVDRDGKLVMVGLELVREGFARISTFSPDTRYRTLLADAQQEARIAGIGMWGAHPTPAAVMTPAPVETALPRLVGTTPISVFGSTPTVLHGDVGIYTWPSVSFTDPNVTVHWDVRPSATRACELSWHIEPAIADPAGGTIVAKRLERQTGKVTVATPFTDALLTVTSTCPQWTLTLQGTATP
jgi:micrococcal nuclease